MTGAALALARPTDVEAADRFPGLPSSRHGLEQWIHQVATTLIPIPNPRSLAAMVDTLCAARSCPDAPPAVAPVIWTATSDADGTVVLMDGDRCVGILRPGVVSATDMAVLANARRMFGILQELAHGPCEPNVWSRVTAVIDSVRRGVRRAPLS